MSNTGSNAAVKRVEIAPGLSGLDRIKLLLAANGFASVAAWARSVGELPQAAFQAFTGARRNAASDRILGKLADSVGKSRRIIDALVRGEAEPVTEITSNDVGDDSVHNA